MAVQFPWDKAAAFTAIRSEVLRITEYTGDQVQVSDQDHPIGARPFVRLNDIAFVDLSPHKQTALQPLKQRERVTVTSAADDTYIVTVLGTDHPFVAVSETITGIRDGLVAALTGPTTFTVAAVSTDALDVEGTAAGVHLQLSASPASLTVVRQQENATKHYAVPSELAVSIMCYTKRDETAPTLNDDAQLMAHAIAVGLDTHIGQTGLQVGGLVFRRAEDILNLNLVLGSQSETRASVTIHFGLHSGIVDEIGAGESALVEGTIAAA